VAYFFKFFGQLERSRTSQEEQGRRADATARAPAVQRSVEKQSYNHAHIQDLVVKRTLGQGAFGRVKLVTHYTC
jgi:hypothetical protein